MSSNPKNIRPPAGHEPLDAIDERLLAALVDDARISNKQLAELVGIAPSTAHAHPRSFGPGHHPGIRGETEPFRDWPVSQALIAVRLRAHDREQIDRFTSPRPQAARRAVNLPHVRLGRLSAAHRRRHHRGPAGLGSGQPCHRPRGGPHRNRSCSTTCRATTGRCRNRTDQAPARPARALPSDGEQQARGDAPEGISSRNRLNSSRRRAASRRCRTVSPEQARRRSARSTRPAPTRTATASMTEAQRHVERGTDLTDRALMLFPFGAHRPFRADGFRLGGVLGLAPAAGGLS